MLEQNALSQGTRRRRHQGQLDLGCLGWPQALPLKVTGRADPARGANTVGRRQSWPGAERWLTASRTAAEGIREWLPGTHPGSAGGTAGMQVWSEQAQLGRGLSAPLRGGKSIWLLVLSWSIRLGSDRKGAELELWGKWLCCSSPSEETCNSHLLCKHWEIWFESVVLCNR